MTEINSESVESAYACGFKAAAVSKIRFSGSRLPRGKFADMFHKLVDITKPICREIDAKKADYLIFYTTGIEPYVAENDSVPFQQKWTQKSFKKRNESQYLVNLRKPTAGV